MYDPCEFCFINASEKHREWCKTNCLYYQALLKATAYDSIPKIDIEEFNKNVVSKEFLESCRKAGKLFNRR